MATWEAVEPAASATPPPADQSVSTFRTCNHPVAIDCQGVAEAIAQLLAAVAQRLRLSACLGAQWKGTDQAAAGQTLGAESLGAGQHLIMGERERLVPVRRVVSTDRRHKDWRTPGTTAELCGVDLGSERPARLEQHRHAGRLTFKQCEPSQRVSVGNTRAREGLPDARLATKADQLERARNPPACQQQVTVDGHAKAGARGELLGREPRLILQRVHVDRAGIGGRRAHMLGCGHQQLPAGEIETHAEPVARRAVGRHERLHQDIGAGLPSVHEDPPRVLAVAGPRFARGTDREPVTVHRHRGSEAHPVTGRRRLQCRAERPVCALTAMHFDQPGKPGGGRGHERETQRHGVLGKGAGLQSPGGRHLRALDELRLPLPCPRNPAEQKNVVILALMEEGRHQGQVAVGEHVGAELVAGIGLIRRDPHR